MDRELRKILCDKLYDKRKLAALGIEQVVRDAVTTGDRAKIDTIISELAKDYAYAVRNPNYRNGGLIGLAAVAIALGQVDLAAYLEDIMPPVLSCFGDADSWVRYYACESLYNVAKVAKGEILQFFNEIFDTLVKLAADPETFVRNGADLVDRLLKDIVAEKAATYTFIISRQAPVVPQAVLATSTATPPLQAVSAQTPEQFSLANFVPLLSERIYVINPSARMFLVHWIVLLDSVPDLNLVSFLPEFLDGLLQFLNDSRKEIRVATKAALDGFLREIKAITALQNDDRPEALFDTSVASSNDQQPQQNQPDEGSLSCGLYVPGRDTFVDYKRIIGIMLDNLDSSQEEICYVSLQWLRSFLEFKEGTIMADISRLATVLLPTLSDQNVEVRLAGEDLNARILAVLQQRRPFNEKVPTSFNLPFFSENETTRLAALDWLVATQGLTSVQINSQIMYTLLKLLNDQSDNVVNKVFELLARILGSAEDDALLAEYVAKVLGALKSNRRLMVARGKTLLSRFCTEIDVVRMYCTLADVLDNEPDREFASTVVNFANNSLLMSKDLRSLRQKLSDTNTAVGAALFSRIFRCWCWDAVAAFSLCLSAQEYEHAYALLQHLSALSVTVEVLVNIDKLIKLIESPMFARMRMQLLEPERYPYLYRCLYGLLMILPQSPAYELLRSRLDGVRGISGLPPQAQAQQKSTNQCFIDWTALLAEFQRKQIELELFNEQGSQHAPTTVVAPTNRAAGQS